jgi:hypothetical protein
VCRLYDIREKFNTVMLEKSKNDTRVIHFAWYLTFLFAVTGKIISAILRPNVIDTLYYLLHSRNSIFF